MIPTPDCKSEISILYVEDDPVARGLLCKMIQLKFPGVKLVAAENGQMGLEMFKEQKPDVVLTDVSMPVMDGVRMASEIRALNPDVPIVLITAHNDTQYLLGAIEIGINRYVLKPVNYEKLFQAIADCIARITLERKVKEQNEVIRKISRAVEQSPSTIVITDAKGTIEYVNPKFTKLTGYTTGEVVGQNPRILKSNATPPETYAKLWRTITSGLEWRGEFHNLKKNGEPYWESASISPVFDEERVVTHFVAVKEDITERKKAEEQIEILNTNLAAHAIEMETTNLKLKEANEDLEAFNYTVSHDLRTPLTNIHGSGQVVLEIWGGELNEQCRNFVQTIVSETERMDRLITSLLNFSRISRSELHCELVDLSRMANEIAAGLRFSQMERQAEFKIADGITAHGDASLLRVVLDNLLGNAWKYAGKNESTSIEFGKTEQDMKPAYFVRDNGAGFDMDQAHKLFGTFQRLHSNKEFEGNGIGLATVQRIVQRHGGRVWAVGEIGKGATFYFTL